MSTRATLSIPQLQTIPSEVELNDSQKLLPPGARPERISESGEEAGTPGSRTPGRRASDAKPGRRRASTTASTSGRARMGSLTGGSGRPRRGSTATYVSLSHDDPLDAHVVDVLTKRQKFKRAMKGLGKFLLTPLGVFFFFYGVSDGDPFHARLLAFADHDINLYCQASPSSSGALCYVLIVAVPGLISSALLAPQGRRHRLLPGQVDPGQG